MRQIALLSAAVLALTAAPALAADGGKKDPPSCAAISFRPVPQGTGTNGEFQAGTYKSRFGRMALISTLANGQPTGYWVTINGKMLTPLQGDLPKSVNSCLNSKNVKTPVEAAAPGCIGQRYRVVINNTTPQQKLFMLFTLDGDRWKLCQAGTAAG